MILCGWNGIILMFWNCLLKNDFVLKLQWVHVSGGLLILLSTSAIIVNGLLLKKQNKKGKLLVSNYSRNSLFLLFFT